MNYYVQYISDVIGNNYLGIDISQDAIKPFLKTLEELIEDEYDKYTSNQIARDHGKYHLTVINVSDYNKLANEIGHSKFVNLLEPLFDWPIDDIKMMGVGTAERNGNRAYFVVCKSEKLPARLAP
jgi:hypothetical protein